MGWAHGSLRSRSVYQSHRKAANPPSPSGDGGFAAFPPVHGEWTLYNIPMSNAVLQIPLRTLNRDKADRLEAMRAEFTDCVRFHLGRIEATGITDMTALH